MVAIVRLALKRPYTFIVLAILIVIFGVMAAIETPTDIFPNINIPVIATVWTYRGLSPDAMADRVIYYYERQLSTVVNDIDHIESQSFFGIGIVKIFFHPGVNISTASAQVTSISQTVVKQLPPGITPPEILNYNAATVPIIQLALSSTSLPEQTIFDLGQNFIRPALAQVKGSAVPSPYGGKERQIQIDLNPEALQARNLSAEDVAAALSKQNQIIPAGDAKIGQFDYNIELNNSPVLVDELNDLPVKEVNGTTIYIRDIGHARDGFPPQRNIVRINGRRGVLMTVLNSGSASTLDIVGGVKAILPRLKESLPASLNVEPIADQSIFVRAAISGVIKEGVIAASLTGLMVLLFLGSWRSTLIIIVSIPLAVLASVAVFSALGQTLNIMTLGGLALSVGILVDNATVTIENFNLHLESRKSVPDAILDGALQIVTPNFVSLLCICIAFVPMFFLPGVSGFLFAPMAEAVVFAMIASFVLSITLVPTIASYLLVELGSKHDVAVARTHDASIGIVRILNPLVRVQHGFEQHFERARSIYKQLLSLALNNRHFFAALFMVGVLLSFGLAPFLGSNFFPSVDSGQISIHARAPIGTRIEESAAIFDHIERRIRQVIPADQVVSIVDNIALPVSGINRAYSNTGSVGPEDGDILVTLAEDHDPIAGYIKSLRGVLPQSFPGTTFAFLPADIVSQILNFGAPAPIDVQVTGPDKTKDEAYAGELARLMTKIPGAADVRLQQSSHYPEFGINVDRTHAGELGVSELDVTNSLVVNLASSFQVDPTFWVDPRNGVSYPIVMQTPQYDVDTLSKLEGIPVTGSNPNNMQVLGGLSTFERKDTDAVVSHYAIQPTFDVYATPQERDLGSLASLIQRVIKNTSQNLPPGATVAVRGQAETMNTAFHGLFFGLAEAIVLIYLLIVVNFHSWTDPFVILTALPAALAGIVWTLFTTHTTLSVPALTGAIMCMGVATANSILLVSFAREQLKVTGDAVLASINAGVTRLRPILMTALAMIIGMTPMALAFGEGGEQNAPLGRAVIGGLLFATISTLFFVPVVFALVHGSKQITTQRTPRPDGRSVENPMPTNAIEPALLRRNLKRGTVVAAVVGGVILLAGLYVRYAENRELDTWTASEAVPTVGIVLPSPEKTGQKLVLPGTLQAFYDANIYSRVPGYVNFWYQDIGAKVHKGDLLATIDTPELDQQILEARADLGAAVSAQKLSQTTAQRWDVLLPLDSVSKQDTEEKDEDFLSKTGLVNAAQANLSRLEATKKFARIVAPFDGVVTKRTIDIGALVSVGSDSGSEPLFAVSDTNPIRVYVQVPQSYASQIVTGMTASLTLPEYPGRVFQATLISTSNAISDRLGSLLVELQADNRYGLLKPGAYAQVSFDLSQNAGRLHIPVSALMLKGEGLQVATIGPKNQIAMKSIGIAHDLGTEVEVASGLRASDRVVDNPPDSLANGDRVRVGTESNAK